MVSDEKIFFFGAWQYPRGKLDCVCGGGGGGVGVGGGELGGGGFFFFFFLVSIWREVLNRIVFEKLILNTIFT